MKRTRPAQYSVLSTQYSGLAIALALAILTLGPSLARAAEDLDVLEQKAFRAAVDRVAPSVVRIETVGGMERVGRVLFGTGPTTGLIVSPDGYIVSSAFNFLHNPASILVQLPDGTRKAARRVATDRNRMLVLLKVDAAGPLPVPEIAPQAGMRVGQWTIAVGRTFEGGQPNMAVGILSALNRIWGKAIQTDAAVSPNNYGGPLVDVYGRVLGVLVPMSPQETAEMAGMEWYDSGIGFAVPGEAIQKILPRLKQGKDLLPGVIGISFAARNLSTAEPVIAAVRPSSPAHRAGLKAGDRIVQIDGRQITLAAHVKEEIARRYAGEKMHLIVMRDGKRTEHDLELLDKLPPYQHPFLGVLPLRDAAGPKGDKKPVAGVSVRYVYPDSPAARAGVKPGDVLTSLAGQAVVDAADMRQKMADHVPGARVPLELRRGQQKLALQVMLDKLPEGLPPATLPPAYGAAPASQGERPKVGRLPLKVPEFRNEAWALVPDNYDPAKAHGLVVWLHAPGGYDEKALIARWKPHLERDRLMLLVPKAADPAKWEPREAALILRLMGELGAAYKLDPTRIVVLGREGGGTLAYLAAFASAGIVRAVAAIDAPLTGPAPETEPLRRQAFYVARAEKSRFAAQIGETIATLRERKYPVSVKPLGPEPRDLNADELAELARWIDTLDRI